MTYAVTRGGAPGQELAASLSSTNTESRSNGDDSDTEMRRLADLVEAAGGRRWAVEEADRRLELAEQALQGVPLDPHARNELVEIAHFVVAREV